MLMGKCEKCRAVHGKNALLYCCIQNSGIVSETKRIVVSASGIVKDMGRKSGDGRFIFS